MTTPPALATFLAEPEPWVEKAACRGVVDRDLFFPGKGEDTRQAKKVCYSCPVRQECLDYALEHGEKFGIWGGTTERERRRMRRGMVHAPQPIRHGTVSGYVVHLRRHETACPACRDANHRYRQTTRPSRPEP